MLGRDTFWITYEQLNANDAVLETTILPALCAFLGVDPTVPLLKLRETIKQADPNENLAAIIENYDQLEFCFRHSNVSHFVKRRASGVVVVPENAPAPASATATATATAGTFRRGSQRGASCCPFALRSVPVKPSPDTQFTTPTRMR